MNSFYALRLGRSIVLLLLTISFFVTLAIGTLMLFALLAFLWLLGVATDGNPAGTVGVLLLGVGAATLAGYTVSACIEAVRRRGIAEPAIVLRGEQQKRLASTVAEVCSIIGCKPPTATVLTLNPVLSVVDGRVRTAKGTASGRVLMLGMPLMMCLSTEEFRAVLAHEFAHIDSRDTVYRSIAAPVHNGILLILDTMRSRLFANTRNGLRWITRIPLMLPYSFLRVYERLFSRAENRLYRSMELNADDIACSKYGVRWFSSGLTNVVGASGAFQSLLKSIETSGAPFPANVFQTLHSDPDWTREFQNSISAGFGEPEDETADHPSLATRIARLRVHPVVSDADLQNDDSRAIDLLTAPTGAQLELTSIYASVRHLYVPSLPPAAPMSSVPGPAPAPFLRRLCAGVLDNFIFFLVLVPVIERISDNEGFDAALMVCCYCIYFGSFEASSMQATIGKRLLGLKVSSAHDCRLPFWRSAIRSLLKLLGMGQGLLIAPFTERHQALYDLWTNAVVVSTNTSKADSNTAVSSMVQQRSDAA